MYKGEGWTGTPCISGGWTGTQCIRGVELGHRLLGWIELSGGAIGGARGRPPALHPLWLCYISERLNGSTDYVQIALYNENKNPIRKTHFVTLIQGHRSKLRSNVLLCGLCYISWTVWPIMFKLHYIMKIKIQ